MFVINVPSGVSGLTFSMSSGSGDADLYTKFGSEPTINSYDCRPYRSGNNETCEIMAIEEDRYYAMIDGYSAFSGRQLIVSYEVGTPAASTPNECPFPDPNSSCKDVMEWLRCQNPRMPQTSEDKHSRTNVQGCYPLTLSLK
jgi:hypothetical protein